MTMLRALFAAILLIFIASPALAQIAPAPDAEATPTVAPDAFGRETPRSSVTELLGALAARDYARAAHFFDLPVESSPRVADEAAELARRLQAALDAGGTLMPFPALANEPTGRTDDGLAADLEQIGELGGEGGGAILLSRSEGPDGTQVWRISDQTIDQLRERTSPAEEASAEETGFEIWGAPVTDWLILLGIAAAMFLVFRLIAAGILALIRGVITERDNNPAYRFTQAALPPLSLFLAVLSYYVWSSSIEVSIVARQTLLRYIGIVAWIALAWFLLRLVDAIAVVATARMRRAERRQAVSIVTFLRRTAKVLLLAIAGVAILDTVGLDVTTGIAALGIGGLALALGAQKTIENLVGSVTVIADKPVQVGDFCRVGDVVGTVEDIGMRSTRIRTNERTVVTIPNGNFASLQIENFATRDRFLFNPTIGLEYDVTAAKLREGIRIVEQALFEHEKIDNDGARARLANFGASSLDIEVFSYITVSDFAESLVIREQLLLTILERLEAAGMGIAFPTRTIHIVGESAKGDHAP